MKKVDIDFSHFDTNLGMSYSELGSKTLGRDLWVVNRGLVFCLDKYETQKVYVPAGFLTDGASVPRPFWNLIPPWGKYGQACVVHDFLCEYLKVWCNGRYIDITRERADEILYKGMSVLNVPLLQRQTIYQAVCLHRLVSAVAKQPRFDRTKYDVEQELVRIYQQTGQWT